MRIYPIFLFFIISQLFFQCKVEQPETVNKTEIVNIKSKIKEKTTKKWDSLNSHNLYEKMW